MSAHLVLKLGRVFVCSQEVLDNTSNAISQISFNGRSASPWRLAAHTLLTAQFFTLIGWVRLTALHSDWLSRADRRSRDCRRSVSIEQTDSQSVSSYLMTSGDLDNQRTENTDIWVRNKHANDLLSLSVTLSLFLYLDKGNVESEIVILILYGIPNAFILTVSNAHCKMPVKIFINLQYFYIGASYENEIKRSNVICGTMSDD